MKKTLFACWYLTLFTLMTIISGLICLLVSLFSKGLSRRITGQVWARIVLDPAFVKVEVVRGQELLPSPNQGGYIIFANHRSLLDIPTVAQATKRNVSWVAKQDLGRIPIFGWTLKRVHMLIDRQGGAEAAKRMISQASARLSAGEILAIFPEGTRNKTEAPLLPFKKGAFIMAKHSQVPLVPLAIYNSGKLWPSGSLTPEPGTIKVAIGEPLRAHKDQSLNLLRDRAQKSLEELYLSLEKDWA
ncbi:MAG: 1-acyl-sn-glycerol-3-phosphate acyltransferase [Deltaproteobacteria bacterium]|jgi:1-acyl-sn-glycerol-3-phosphate acyltransferase|nr:1-acyl-sn-glycerol-3-phosphate acyltransferase [Deltaproteobacteria bacterium]